MRRASPSAGFTLVETLASLTILAMLSLMLMAGAATARLWLPRLTGASQGETIEAAQGLLRARLERSYPNILAQTEPPEVDFGGHEDRLDFVAPASDARGPDALWRYRLALEPNGDLALYSRNDLALDDAHYAERQVLLHGVASLQLAYFGPSPPDGAARWRDRWDEQPSLPRLVRARVSFAPGDTRRWPDLLIRPAAELDSACVLSPSTGRCQGRS
jgi:general secretion pathway protein J